MSLQVRTAALMPRFFMPLNILFWPVCTAAFMPRLPKQPNALTPAKALKIIPQWFWAAAKLLPHVLPKQCN
jgi:hypothetical protein